MLAVNKTRKFDYSFEYSFKWRFFEMKYYNISMKISVLFILYVKLAMNSMDHKNVQLESWLHFLLRRKCV